MIWSYSYDKDILPPIETCYFRGRRVGLFGYQEELEFSLSFSLKYDLRAYRNAVLREDITGEEADTDIVKCQLDQYRRELVDIFKYDPIKDDGEIAYIGPHTVYCDENDTYRINIHLARSTMDDKSIGTTICNYCYNCILKDIDKIEEQVMSLFDTTKKRVLDKYSKN